jgi:molecular chaperone HtpG
MTAASQPERERFQVDLRGLVDVLAHHLYSTREVFVREFLQNAVDALAARRIAEPDFQGLIAVEVDPQAGTMTVIDDGIGLTVADVRDALAKIGASTKRGAPGQGARDYIGQFGIGVLSAFLVCDELVVLSRHAAGDSPSLEWRAFSDGTYALRTLETRLEPGTRVVIRFKADAAEYADEGIIDAAVRKYASMLPDRIDVRRGKLSYSIGMEPPWTRDPTSDDDRAALLDEARWTIGADAVDTFPIRDDSLGLRGTGYVLRATPPATEGHRHRIYVKGMFVTDSPGRLVPEWGVFARCVLDSDTLKPTASREGLREDGVFDKTRGGIARAMMAYLRGLRKKSPERLAALLAAHDLALRRAAVEDDEFFDAIIDMMSFDTSLGERPFGALRGEHTIIRIAATHDQYRLLAPLAGAQGLLIFNGGYTYHAELLDKAARRITGLTQEPVDPLELLNRLGNLTPEDRRRFEPVHGVFQEELNELGCRVRMACFEPADTAAV